jgi:hypothetical protein
MGMCLLQKNTDSARLSDPTARKEALEADDTMADHVLPGGMWCHVMMHAEKALDSIWYVSPSLTLSLSLSLSRSLSRSLSLSLLFALS